MRSIFIRKSQQLPLSEIVNYSQHYLFRYGQIFIYLVGTGLISYFFLLLQGMIINYVDGLALGDIPNINQ